MGNGTFAAEAAANPVWGIGDALGLFGSKKPEGPQRGEITDPTTGKKREASDEEKAGWVNAQGQAASAADDAAVEAQSAKILHHKNPFTKKAAPAPSQYSVARTARKAHNNFLGGGEVKAGLTEA